MTRLIMDVSANRPSLLAILPEQDGWYLESEEYEGDGSGVIVAQNDQEDELSLAAKRVLNATPEVICYYQLEEYYEREENLEEA